MMPQLATTANIMDNTHQNQRLTKPLTERETPFRISSVEQLPILAQDESCRIIKQYFDYVESALTQKDRAIDIDKLREMLNELSGFIRSGKSQIKAEGYLRMLKRLTHIYALGVRAQDDRAFTSTAVNFADILKAASQTDTGYDYSESVGLLLYYMNKLFSYREEGWIKVFEYLLSMPDSIQVMQMLKVQHLQEIQNWIEEGVDNLFAIWDEQLEVIEKLNSEISDLDKVISERNSVLLNRTAILTSSVVSLSLRREKQSIEALYAEKERAIEELGIKTELASLLECNIKEFTDRLTEIRRATLIQLVWDNPDKD
ncbi:MAG: hypothetical protein P8179_13395 [Candidatus Thiodiazotropha sp.]|jgi:hypothetical protein